MSLKDTRKRNKTRISPQQLLDLSKLPPQAVELESAVLGELMMDRQALADVIDILSPETFYKSAHQLIFSAIHTLFHNSEPVDILTVVQRLKKDGKLEEAGGAFYVTQLTNRVASSANVEMHSRIIIEEFIKRQVIMVSTTTLQTAYEDTSDVFELLEVAEQGLFSVTQNTIKKNYESLRTLLGQAIEQIENSRDQKFKGVPSGFTRLDSITGGWQNADLVILGARPAMGKTSFMLSLARNACVEHGKPVAIFSLEMTSLQLVNRLISGEAEITAEKIRRGDFSENDFKELHSKIGKLVEAPMFIDDTPAISIFDFRAKAKRLKAQHKIELIIIDYLQLMTAVSNGKNGNREQEVGLISRSLKAIAKELDIPIIALAQLSRAMEQRGGNKHPQLSDLRESGSMEQDADLVMFIHRPEYYGILADDDGNSTQGIAEIIVAKHRNGRVGKENLMFIQQFTKFVEPSEILYSSSVMETGNINDVDSV
jgi:replicative DNA helicase